MKSFASLSVLVASFALSVGFFSVSIATPTTIYAAEPAGVVLLQPGLVPGTADGQGNLAENPGTYIAGLFKLAVGIGGVIAVVVLIWGGFEYIASSANPQLRTDATSRITAALGGLILLIFSVTLAGTINKRFVNFSLNLEQLGSKSSGASGAGASGTSGKSGITHEEAKDQLKDSGVGVGSTGNCETEGVSNCTNLAGVQQKTLDATKNVADALGCDKNSTKCTASGGTEPGHTLGGGPDTHTNGWAIDLQVTNPDGSEIKGAYQDSKTIQDFLSKSNATFTKYVSGYGPKYTMPDGSTVLVESNHLHIEGNPNLYGGGGGF